MTVRFPTSGTLAGVALAFLLAALLILPTSAIAQVIFGAGVASSGPGSGTVTSIATTSPITGGTITTSGTIACPTCVTGTFTTGVVPMGTGAHTLADSLNAVVLGTNGAFGFNTPHFAEIVSGGASLANAGVWGTLNSDMTIHGATSFTRWGLTFWNDVDTINNACAITVSGANPANTFEVDCSDGAGGQQAISQAVLSAADSYISAGTDTTHFSRAELTPSVANVFVTNDDSSINRTAQVFSGNSTGTIHASASGVLGASNLAVAQLEATNTSGSSRLQLVATPAGVNYTSTVDLVPWKNAHGGVLRLQFIEQSQVHSVSLQGPDSVASFVEFRLPATVPTVTGQPLVGTVNDGDGVSTWSFATGATIGAADVTVVGHYLSSTTTPAVTNTTANSCGTTAATIVGTDVAGKVTVGATAGTSCTVTFTTAFANAPACMVTNETTANLVRATSTTTTVILAGTMVAGDKLAYICMGRV